MGAGKLEENSRSPRNCKHVYSLLSGAAAVAADNAVFSPLVVDPADIAIMLPQQLSRRSLYRFTEQKWPVVKGVHHDTHAQCYK